MTPLVENNVTEFENEVADVETLNGNLRWLPITGDGKTKLNRVLKTLNRVFYKNKAKKIALLASYLALMCAKPVYAGWEQVYVDVTVPPKGTGCEETIEQVLEWKYIDENGNYLSDTDFIDVDGNVYHFDSNGVMLHDTQIDRRVFTTSGAVANGLKRDSILDNALAEWQEGDYHRIPKRFKGIFSMYAGVYMSDQGLLKDWNGKRLTWYREYEDSYELGNPVQGHSELVENEVTELASKVVGDTVQEKVASAIRLVSDRLDGDHDDILGDDASSLHRVLETGKSTCMGYSELTQRVLEKAGIHTELCIGHIKTGEYHMWIRVDLQQCEHCKIQCHHTEHWLYADPSWYDGYKALGRKADAYLNIPYDFYVDTYSMESLY